MTWGWLRKLAVWAAPKLASKLVKKLTPPPAPLRTPVEEYEALCMRLRQPTTRSTPTKET